LAFLRIDSAETRSPRSLIAVGLCLLALFGIAGCGGGSSGGEDEMDLFVTRGPGFLELRWTPPDLRLGAGDGYGIFVNGRETNDAFGIGGPELGAWLVGLNPARRYCIVIRVTSGGGNVTRRNSNEVCASPLPDNSPPDPPFNLRVNATSAVGLGLGWDRLYRVNSLDISGYKLFRDGVQFGTTSSFSVFDGGLLADQDYCYRVSSFDFAGNESSPSPEVCARTLQDLQNPTSAAELTAVYTPVAGNTQIDLSWIASEDDGAIDVYRVYRDGVYLADASGTNFIDNVAGLGGEYCYTVIAVDTTGKESIESPPACGERVWRRSRIVDCCGGGQIAIDPADRMHAAYKSRRFDSASSQHYLDLHYVYRDTGVWSSPVTVSESEEPLINFQNRVDVAADSNGVPHLFHIAQPRFFPLALYYETSVPGFWTQTAVENSSEVNYIGSIAVDSAAAAHVCYVEENNLRYATNASGGWVIDTLVDLSSMIDFPRFCKIEVDALDFVHIIYSDTIAERLTHLTNASGSWVGGVVDNGARVLRDAAIATNALNEALVVYFDVDSQELRLATNVGGAWNSLKLEDMDLSSGPNPATYGVNPDIEIDADDKVHISFINGFPWVLHYATDRFGSWRRFNINYPVTIQRTSLAIDSGGNLYIGYVNDDSEFWLASND
jgi:hypothetical protein